MLRHGALCLLICLIWLFLIGQAIDDRINVTTYITGPLNGSICGSNVNLKLHVDLILSASGHRINNYYEGINVCIYKNSVFFACINSFNPHYALVCEVDYGRTVIDVYAGHSTMTMGGSMIELGPHVVSNDNVDSFISHAAVTVFRPILTHDDIMLAATRGTTTATTITDVTAAAVDETTAVSDSLTNSSTHAPLPYDNIGPLKLLLDGLIPFYRPFDVSVLMISDNFKIQSMDSPTFPYGVGDLNYDPAVAAVALTPLRLVLLDVHDNHTHNIHTRNSLPEFLDTDFCARLDVCYIRCQWLNLTREHTRIDGEESRVVTDDTTTTTTNAVSHAALRAYAKEIPPLVHVAVIHLLDCSWLQSPSWYVSPNKQQQQRINSLRILAEVSLRRTTGHFIVLLSQECREADILDPVLLESANQTFQFKEFGQIGYVFVSPTQRRWHTRRHSATSAANRQQQAQTTSTITPVSELDSAMAEAENRTAATSSTHSVSNSGGDDDDQRHRHHKSSLRLTQMTVRKRAFHSNSRRRKRSSGDNNEVGGLSVTHELHLTNVCLLRNNSLVVFTPASPAPPQSNVLGDFNKKSNQQQQQNVIFNASITAQLNALGFLPWIRRYDSMLAPTGNTGYTNIFELEVGSNDCELGNDSTVTDVNDKTNNNGSHRNCSNEVHMAKWNGKTAVLDDHAVVWSAHKAVLVRPYYKSNIFHFVQSLVDLLIQQQQVDNGDRTRRRSRSSDSYSSIGSNSSGMEDIIQSVHVLLPDYFTSGYSLEWCDSFLEVVQSWLDGRDNDNHSYVGRLNMHGKVDKKKDSGRSGNADVVVASFVNSVSDSSISSSSSSPSSSSPLQLFSYYSQEQIYSLFESPMASSIPAIDADHKILCFEEVQITGQGNTDIGFFHDRNLLYAFREHLWGRVAPSLFISICATESYREEALDSSMCSDIPDTSGTETGSDAGIGIDTDSPRPPLSLPFVLLKVTVVLRTHNRYILNYHELIELLSSSPSLYGVIDQEWLHSEHHSGVVFDTLSFQQQMTLMMETDVLIAVHGSVFVNAMFMTPHSVAIALMQSRHIEYVLPQVINQGDVDFEFVPLLNQNNTGGCGCASCVNEQGQVIDHQGNPVKNSGHIYLDICEDPSTSLIRAGQMDCLGIRQCNPIIDLPLFESVLIKSMRKILISKYKNRPNRLISTSTIVHH